MAEAEAEAEQHYPSHKYNENHLKRQNAFAPWTLPITIYLIYNFFFFLIMVNYSQMIFLCHFISMHVKYEDKYIVFTNVTFHSSS